MDAGRMKQTTSQNQNCWQKSRWDERQDSDSSFIIEKGGNHMLLLQRQ